MLTSEQEIVLVEFLAHVYASVRWKQMKTSKNPYDIFCNRVKASTRRSNIYEFASRLCNYLGISSLPVCAVECIDSLRPDDVNVLNTLSREYLPLCVKAISKAKEIKEKRKKQKKKGENQDEEN